MLRSFAAIVDAGSMLKASDQVCVTQSALSLQIKRLEELVQRSLFVREGRSLSLTPAGTLLLDYTRRVLSLHDEAVAAVSAGQPVGPVRFGMIQDFAETLLAGLLSQFLERHPEARIYTSVAGTAELQSLLERRQLDVIVGFAAEGDPRAIATAPMHWYGDAELAERTVIPLAVLEAPCRFRDAAIRNLEAAGRPYRIAVETPNLTTLRAALNAGLGITCRTPMFLKDAAPLTMAPHPALPNVTCIMQTVEDSDGTAQLLADLARETINALRPGIS